MPAASYSVLSIRLRAPNADKPDLYHVDFKVNDFGSKTATVSIRLEEFADLESDLWEYGRTLGKTLFGDSNLQRALNFARGSAPRVLVSLEIDPEASKLQDLMWEHLIYESASDLPFSVSDKITFSRRIPLDTPTVVPSEGPFRMLLFIASPDGLKPESGMPPINLKEEIGGLRQAWDSLVQAGLMRISIVGRVPEDLNVELQNAGYTVYAGPATLSALADQLTSVDSLHLISHGMFKNDKVSLLFEDPDGKPALASEEDLLAKFGEQSLRLVFLQACKGAARTKGRPIAMSGLAPKMAQRAACVVGMQDFVRIDDARQFAQEFYDTLLSTGIADVAANAGRRTLYRPDSTNWAIPALYLTPMAERLWEPDAVLRAVQDVAEQFRRKSDVKNPFPVDVIRQTPGVSSKMENSPPGPRIRVLEAVSSALNPGNDQTSRSPIVVIAGNYGRAKTAQLYLLYTQYARQASRRDVVPFFAQISDFGSGDETPEVMLSQAISATYKRLGVEVSSAAIERRLAQKFMVCLDSDQDADSRRHALALECVKAITRQNPQASAVITLNEQLISKTNLKAGESESEIPVLLVQLLSPSTVAQYLIGLGDDYRTLLSTLQRANLFDLACVPWLLSYLVRHSSRSGMSRSGVIARIVTGNFAEANIPAGVHRIVHDLLGRMAWVLQTEQAQRLDGGRIYEILDQVRGHREVQLEQLKAHAINTQIVTAIDEDAIRFAYPGFQSYWCAQHLLDSGPALNFHLDDITATLGRRSRVRHWEDTLVLLAGMMDAPERLIDRILDGSSMSQGEQVFLAARCIHEAKQAKREVGQRVIDQVLDSLVWRSTPMKESSSWVRVRATESLALLKDRSSVPHLFSLVIEKVRPTSGGGRTFELSSLRHAALQVLLTMQDETDAYIKKILSEAPTPVVTGIRDLMELWRNADCAGLQQMFRDTSVEGLPAVIAFVLGTSGNASNMAFLIDELIKPGAAEDTQWSIVDSLLFFDPGEVTQRAVTRLRDVPALHTQAAHIIGKLQAATRGSDEERFLVSCLNSASVHTRGVALGALAQLGITDYRRHCELIATGAWDKLARSRDISADIVLPRKPEDRFLLRRYALESLRRIGDAQSLKALREAREWRLDGSALDSKGSQLMQLSYEVSEDLYWSVTGGSEGDYYDPSDRPMRPR